LSAPFIITQDFNFKLIKSLNWFILGKLKNTGFRK
jgi:hypothetical protein